MPRFNYVDVRDTEHYHAIENLIDNLGFNGYANLRYSVEGFYGTDVVVLEVEPKAGVEVDALMDFDNWAFDITVNADSLVTCHRFDIPVKVDTFEKVEAFANLADALKDVEKIVEAIHKDWEGELAKTFTDSVRAANWKN